MTRKTGDVKRGDGWITERGRKDGSVAFQANWEEAGRKRSKTLPTREQAEDYLREQGRKRRRPNYTPESDDTVADVVRDYINRGAGRWTANTVATYTLLANQQINPRLGRTRLVALTTPQVQRWLDDLTASGLSAAVIENARGVLSGACKEAQRFGMLTSNPVDGTRAPARPRDGKATWTPDQIDRVLEAVEQERDDHTRIRLRAFYLLALTTAIRPGELRALMWKDIDVERGIFTVRRTMTRDAEYHHKIGTQTKTKRTRSITLPEETLEALRAVKVDQARRRLATEFWADLDIVFDRGDGHPLAQQTTATWHRRICERAKVPRIRLHDLRHTAATLMLANNVHPKIVADMLGHSSVATTLDIYSHTDVSLQRAASEQLAETIIRRKRKV